MNQIERIIEVICDVNLMITLDTAAVISAVIKITTTTTITEGVMFQLLFFFSFYV